MDIKVTQQDRERGLSTPDVHADRHFIRELLRRGHERDVNKGGLCDSRSGCVNFWCSPEDKPDCWATEIIQGSLAYPRAYVGGLYWNWREDDTVTFYVDVSPFDLLRDGAGRTRQLSDETWESVLAWIEAKAMELINETQRSLHRADA